MIRRHSTRIGSVSVMAAGYGAAAVVAVLFALNLVMPRLTGTVPLTVLTGSMSPTISAGSLVLVRPTSVGNLKVGDVITYETAPGTTHYITHRITEIRGDSNDRSFITKGDANRGEDITPVPAGAVRGRVVFQVPMAGTFGNWLRSPAGITAVLILFSVAVLGSARRGRRSDEPVAPTDSATRDLDDLAASESSCAGDTVLAGTLAGRRGDD